MPKVNDAQAVLLSAAAQREDSSLYPLPEQLAPGARVDKAVAGLITSGLAEERETSDPGAVSRTDGDLRFGVFATAAGLAAIGVEPADGDPAQPEDVARSPVPAAATLKAPSRETKSRQVLGLLTRSDGATLPELIAATGWLPHTTRAALTGLRKKGHRIERGKRGEDTCYRIVAADAA